MQGGFTSFPERIDAQKIRARSKSFFDHFSQAKLFFNSQSEPEKNHITDALSFELGKVQTPAIRERMLYFLAQIDGGLAAQVAYALGLNIPKEVDPPLNQSIPADGIPENFQSPVKEGSLKKSVALSMENTAKNSILTRQIAILAADGVNAENLNIVKNALMAAGAGVNIIAPRQGFLTAENNERIQISHSFLTTASVLYDAVYVPGGTNSVATLAAEPDAVHFLNQAFKHCKAIAADAESIQVLEKTYFVKKLPPDYSNENIMKEGIIIGNDPEKLAENFIQAVAQHRFWERENPRKVPA